MVVGIWWAFLRQQDEGYRSEKKMVEDLPALDGLQFIDANHPYIRVGRSSVSLAIRTDRTPVCRTLVGDC